MSPEDEEPTRLHVIATVQAQVRGNHVELTASKSNLSGQRDSMDFCRNSSLDRVFSPSPKSSCGFKNKNVLDVGGGARGSGWLRS